MKTKIFLSNGKYYEVDMSLDQLVSEYLSDESGQLRQSLIRFEEFTINPAQIASLEEIDKSRKKKIGY